MAETPPLIIDDSVGFATALVTHCQGLRGLNLAGCHNFPESAAKVLATRCSNLTSVDFEKAYMTDATVKLLALSSPTLTHASFRDCARVSDDSLIALGIHCPSLTHVDCSSSHIITDAGVRALAEGCHDLRSVDFSECSDITDAATIGKLAKHCPKLTKVNFGSRNLRGGINEAVVALATHCSGLTAVRFSQFKTLRDASVKELAMRCPDLTHVAFPLCSQLTDASVKELALLPRLKKMDFIILAEYPISEEAQEIIRKINTQR